MFIDIILIQNFVIFYFRYVKPSGQLLTRNILLRLLKSKIFLLICHMEFFTNCGNFISCLLCDSSRCLFFWCEFEWLNKAKIDDSNLKTHFTHWRVHVFHITFCPFGYGKQKGRETNDTQFRSRRRSQERRFINSNVRRKCEKQWLAYFDWRTPWLTDVF